MSSSNLHASRHARRKAMLLAALVAALRSGDAAADTWTAPEIRLPESVHHPVIACTSQELARLRRAWQAGRAAGKAVATVVTRADRAMEQPPDFPPRGGRHNQWYQCDRCETGLKTVDATHHACPLCGRVYSGPPYDDVLYRRRHAHLMRDMHDTAWAYAITGDEQYAQHTARLLLGYADRYLDYPYHSNHPRNLFWTWVAGGRVFGQTLTEAVVLATRIAPAYDLVHESSALSVKDHDHVRRDLLIPMLENINKYNAGLNNWQTWHNAAMFAGGAVLHDDVWMRRAVYGGGGRWWTPVASWLVNWDQGGLKRCGGGFLFQMQHSVTGDGMWYENSWGYHFYALKALAHTAEAARRLQIDLWGCPTLQQMVALPARYTMPDGTLPRFGDDTGSRPTGHPQILEPAFAAYGDARLQPLLSSTPNWYSVLHGRDVRTPAASPRGVSALFRKAGHAILRSDGPGGLAAAFVFGPYGGFHGHLDKLSFVFFGYGRELGVDPGRARSQAYRLPIHKRWYKATIAHNTLVVDGKSQRGVEGRLRLFGCNERYAAVSACADKAYRGADLQRTLLLTPHYLLVLDEIKAWWPTQAFWIYHNHGTTVVCHTASVQSSLKHRLAGSEYIDNTRQGKTGGTIRATFENGPVTNRVLVAAAPDTEVITGDGAGATVTDRIPVIMVGRKGRTLRFAAVLEPVSGQDLPVVNNIHLDARDRSWQVIIDRTDAADIVRLHDGNTLTISRKGADLFHVAGIAPQAAARTGRCHAGSTGATSP